MSEYPTTCAELKAMIDAQWPDVRKSRLALELLDTDTLNFIHPDESPPAKSIGILPMVHRVLRPSGFVEDGTFSGDWPLIFSEQDAIRALWFRYNRLTPASNFETDAKPVMFVWRCEPETLFCDGIWTARMRYSCLWRSHRGELQPLPHPASTRRAA